MWRPGQMSSSRRLPLPEIRIDGTWNGKSSRIAWRTIRTRQHGKRNHRTATAGRAPSWRDALRRDRCAPLRAIASTWLRPRQSMALQRDTGLPRGTSSRLINQCDVEAAWRDRGRRHAVGLPRPDACGYPKTRIGRRATQGTFLMVYRTGQPRADLGFAGRCPILCAVLGTPNDAALLRAATAASTSARGIPTMTFTTPFSGCVRQPYHIPLV